jgi:hypothetical protein
MTKSACREKNQIEAPMTPNNTISRNGRRERKSMSLKL